MKLTDYIMHHRIVPRDLMDDDCGLEKVNRETEQGGEEPLIKSRKMLFIHFIPIP